MVIKHNIKLKEQVTRSYTTTRPANSAFVGWSVTNSPESVEYSFIGNKSEIDAQEARELAQASFSPISGTVEVTEIHKVGKSVTTTKTRKEGDIWELNVKINDIQQTLEPAEAPTEDSKEAKEQKEKYGEPEHPRIVNTSVSTVQQSILFHQKFKGLDQKTLGYIKQWMNGASPYTVLPSHTDSEGNTINDYLTNLCPMTEDIKFAIKNPVYYVPTVNITISYWSATPITSTANIGQRVTPTGTGFNIQKPYISLFMGASSSPAEGGGYQIQESYSIGQYDEDLYPPADASPDSSTPEQTED